MPADRRALVISARRELSPPGTVCGLDGDSSLEVEIVKQLVAAELGRREKALDKAEAPDPRRISIMLRGQADLRGL